MRLLSTLRIELEFDRAMKEPGCESVRCDNAMYVLKADGKNVGFGGVNIDDVLFCGDPMLHQTVVKIIRKYMIGKFYIEVFCFTGWSLTQDQNGIERRDSFSRELQSILCSRAPSDRNPGHEDHLQEPPPTQVSGGNVASEANIENVSDVRIVDNEAHQICGVQVPFNLHKSAKVVDAKRKELSISRKFGTFIDIDIRTLNVEKRSKIIIVQKYVNNTDSIMAQFVCA